MKKNLIVLLLFITFLLACTDQTPPTQTEESTQPDVVESNAQLELSVEAGAPNQPFIVQGDGFPPDQIVVVYYAESETNLGPAVAQALTSNLGSFQIELLIPTSWPGADFRGETRLKIVAETIDDPVMASAPITIQYDGALERFENPAGGYALEIPSGWVTTEPQLTPLGEVVLMGPEPISPGSPSNSTIISTSLDQLDALAAAQSLLCGEPGCTEDVVFNLTQINGREAKSVMVGSDDTAFLEWFFITYEDRLLYFSLHDPLTLETIDPLVQTFTLVEQVTASDEEPTEVAEVAQSAAETDTPEPTITPTPILQPTDTPTAEPTATITPTPILQPTNTPAVTPTPTLEPTPTVELDLADPSSIGPLQTSLDLLTILSVSAENRDTLLYLTEAAQESVESPDDIQDFLKLSRTPFAFQAERIQGVVPPVVRVFVQFYVNSPTEAIDLEMVQEEGRWRINAARLVMEDPPPPTVEPTVEEE